MLELLKSFIKRNFTSFAYFYRHLRYRIFIAVGLSIVVGILDGFGLTMFLPLLQMVDGPSAVDPEGLGKLRFLLDGLESIGIGLTLLNILGILCIFFILKGLMKFVTESYKVIVQQYFIKRLRINLVEALNRISFKAFVQSDVGRIQNTMTGEADRVMRAYQFYFRSIQEAVLVTVYMVFAFLVDARFAILVTIGGILTNILYNILYKKTKVASRKVTRDSHGYQGLVIQHSAQFRYLKATGLLHRYGKKLKEAILSLENNNKKIGFYNAILQAAREPLLILVVSGVILLQTMVLGAPLGPILVSLLFFYRALTSLLGMQTTWNGFLGLAGSLENMTEFQTELEANREKTKGKAPYTFEDRITLNDLSFKFGEEPVLRDINLEIKKHQIVAFVGESGSGKTTLVSILAGLLTPDAGSMKVDNTAITDMDMHQFHARIGFITQDPVIFSDTVFNNVTFWAPQTPENMGRFWKALEQAAIIDFVKGLDQKEDSVLGQNGINISGGQKQRISIARELFKNIDILIMDEATSALDSETERSIQINIEQLKGHFTLLIVAHRLSTVKNADKIILLSNGGIVNSGTFEEMITGESRFKRMVEMQEF